MNKNHKTKAVDDRIYDVEKILNKKVVDGKTYYLLKWQDYPESDSSWEVDTNVLCSELVEDFENRERQNLKRKIIDKADVIQPKRKKENNFHDYLADEMADIKKTLKNIESLVMKQNEEIEQLTQEMKTSKTQGFSGRPPPPPPPPPPASKLQPSEKNMKYDMMLNELESVLSKGNKPSEIKSLRNRERDTSKENQKPNRQSTLKHVEEFQKIKLKSVASNSTLTSNENKVRNEAKSNQECKKK